MKYFGEINNRKMVLTEIGEIADKFWREIPNHFTNVRIDEYVIMPNHIHGIIEIIPEIPVFVETPKLGVSTKTSTPMLIFV